MKPSDKQHEALKLSASRVPAALIARSLRVSESTVSRWLRKGSEPDSLPIIARGRDAVSESGLENNALSPRTPALRSGLR